MSGFADFLSSALTVGTQAAGAHEAGIAQKGQRETQDLLQKIQLARQANQDAMANQLRDAQIKNYDSLAQERLKPEPETPRNIDPLSPAGIQAAADRAKKIRAVTPREPSVGEQLRSQRDQEELDAAEAWWNSEPVQSGQAGRVGQTYQKIRAAHPDWNPQRIMRAVKQAVEANAKGANLNARTGKIKGGADNFTIDANGNFVMGAPSGASTPAAPAAPSGAPAPTAKALPPTVDQAKYESDPQYRAWVDGKLGAGQ